MAAAPRRMEALILANGALMKLCFDADAADAVKRERARAFLSAMGFELTTADDAEDTLMRVLFEASMKRWQPAFEAEVAAEPAETLGALLRPARA